LGSLLDVSLKGFPICLITFLSFQFSVLAFRFQFGFIRKFWKAFGLEFFKVSSSSFSLSTIFSPHFQWKFRYHFCRRHYSRCWALVAFIIAFRFQLDFCLFLMEVIKTTIYVPYLSRLIWCWFGNFFLMATTCVFPFE